MKRFNLGKSKHEGEGMSYLAPLNRLMFDDLMEDFFLKPFSGIGPFKGFGRPEIDMYEEGSNLIIKAELPGVEKKDVKIHIADNILTITGEAKREKETKEKNYYQAERFFGRVQRSIALPEGVDAKAIKASHKDGVLKIEIPKPKGVIEQKGKDIEIE